MNYPGLKRLLKEIEMVYKLKGINSEAETCEVCGRTGLKQVMWLDELDIEGNESGRVRAYGTTCGAIALGFSGPGSSKATVDRDINDLMYQTVQAEITRIQNEVLILHPEGVFIPRGYGSKLISGKLTLNDLVKIRNTMYPILEYNLGRISIEQALNYI